MSSYIKTLIVFVSLLFSLIFGGVPNSRDCSQILTAPVSVETVIVKNTFADESSVAQTNTGTKHYFTKQFKCGHVFGIISGLPLIQNIKSDLNNFYYCLKFVNNHNEYLSLYLRNEIYTRAP